MTKPKTQKPACLAKRESFLEGVMRRFDEIGFGNQARIVGVKRTELKTFLRSTIEELVGELTRG